MRKSEYLLYAETAAKYFTDAYPVGNGKLGGMIYGGTDEFKIGLNHDELYAMGETNPLDDYDPAAFKRAQSLALKGDFIAAEKALENGLMKSDSAAYLPFGDMLIDMPKGEISNYTRTLDLKTAVAISFYGHSLYGTILFSDLSPFVCVCSTVKSESQRQKFVTKNI